MEVLDPGISYMHRTIKARAPQLLSLALEPRVPQEKPLQQEARTPELWKGGKLTQCSGMSAVGLVWVLCTEVKSGGDPVEGQTLLPRSDHSFLRTS